MLFESWSGLLRVAAFGVAAYFALVVTLRISGKRTLAKMNAFDFVVTVALGSTLATILLNGDIALLEGMLAFIMLVVLQYVIALLSSRSAWVERLAKSEARPVLIDGVMDRAALHRERVSEEEVYCAVRRAGFGDLADVAAVVLETNGTFSVIACEKAGSRSALPAHEGQRH